MDHPHPLTQFPIVILAAGAATRMRGRDKLLERVDGLPLLTRQARMARRATTGPVIIALPPQPHARYDALAGLQVTAVPVPDAAEGMNASLRAGIGALPHGSPCAMVLLADLPELEEADVNTVFQAVDLKSDIKIWRATSATGQPGHPIIFHADLFARLTELHGDSGARVIVRERAAQVMHIPLPADHAILDLDTPEQWADWRAATGKNG